MIDFLVFSRNRPMQLHSLLSSMYHYIDGNFSITVLHRYDSEYKDALKRVKDQFKNVRFIDESNFREDVIRFLSESNNPCSFLVDDIVVKQRINIDTVGNVVMNNPNLICLSLRLGLHLKHCYTRNLPQKIPSGQVTGDFFVWEWRGTDSDWGYPLSVDGHVFRRNEILSWSNQVAFKSPNQYEDALQLILRSNYNLPLLCACFTRSKMFNIPINRVQNEINNRNEGVSSEEMLNLWNNGNRIDFLKFDDISNESAHFAVELPLTILEEKC